MDTVNQDDLVRERDFYRAKLADANARIKTLEFDCAELVLILIVFRVAFSTYAV